MKYIYHGPSGHIPGVGVLKDGKTYSVPGDLEPAQAKKIEQHLEKVVSKPGKEK